MLPSVHSADLLFTFKCSVSSSYIFYTSCFHHFLYIIKKERKKHLMRASLTVSVLPYSFFYRCQAYEIMYFRWLRSFSERVSWICLPWFVGHNIQEVSLSLALGCQNKSVCPPPFSVPFFPKQAISLSIDILVLLVIPPMSVTPIN